MPVIEPEDKLRKKALFTARVDPRGHVAKGPERGSPAEAERP
jgi:hypothetical protein